MLKQLDVKYVFIIICLEIAKQQIIKKKNCWKLYSDLGLLN